MMPTSTRSQQGRHRPSFMPHDEYGPEGDRSHVSWFSEYAYERDGQWLREVTLDFTLAAHFPKGGAEIMVSCEIPAEQNDPRISEVVRLAHEAALQNLNHALALARRKISEDAFKDAISRQSHLVAHAFLTRAVRVAKRKNRRTGLA
jgi:hypothetical protein